MYLACCSQSCRESTRLVDAARAAATMSEVEDEQSDSDAEPNEPAKRFLIPTSDPINEMDCLGNPQREMLYAGWESGFADERCSVVSRSFRKGFLTASSPFQRLSEKQLYAVFDCRRCRSAGGHVPAPTSPGSSPRATAPCPTVAALPTPSP